MTANVETMAYRYAGRQDVPWHGLGVQIDRNIDISTMEFQEKAGANWPVFKRPVWYKPAEGHPSRKMDDKYVLMRGDNYNALNIVGAQYKPVQNVQVFEFFQEFCDKGDMTLETGGVLDHGRIVWALAQLKEGFILANNDAVTGHLLFSNSHGGDALHIKFTPVRVVCANTLALALHGGHGFRLNHRSVFNPDDAKRVLGLSDNAMKKFAEVSTILVEKRMDSAGFQRFIEALWPARKNNEGEEIIPYARAKASEALGKAPELNHGTWWQGYNAITYMVDHMRKENDSEARLRSAWFGDGAATKLKALNTALEMAK